MKKRMKKFMPMGLTIWSNKVDGCLYKKPNMTKALFFLSSLGPMTSLLDGESRGISYQPMHGDLNDFPVSYFNALCNYKTEEEVRYHTRKIGWFGTYNAFRGEERPGMRANMCYEAVLALHIYFTHTYLCRVIV